MEVYPSAADERLAHMRAVEQAMVQAISSMHYESMLQVMKQILSLRTSLLENVFTGETELDLVFRMAFAREQGVELSDIYNPVSRLGITDTRLAASNLIADMEKSFGIAFTPEESARINTIRDLVEGIIDKRR